MVYAGPRDAHGHVALSHILVATLSGITILGAAFLLARSLLARTFDRWFATGYAAMIVIYVAASKFAVSDAWGQLARAVFNT